jgi:hypothetical protein
MRGFRDYYNEREQGSVNEAGFFQNMFGKKAAPAAPAQAGGQPPAGQDMFPMPAMPAKWNAEVDGDRDDKISQSMIVAYLDAQKNQDQAKMKELEQQITKSGYTDRLQHQLQRCKQLFSKHNFVNRQNGDAYAPFDCADADNLRKIY